jgi:hypothetical protein
MNWPFSDPRNVAVFASRFVVEEGQPIFYVTHDLEDGVWQFHSQNHMETDDKDVRIVALEEVYNLDKSIGELSDLPPGWCAWRQEPGSPWELQEIPKGTMFCLAFDGVPTREHPDFDSVGGASICCWIMADSLADAVAEARTCLEESCWFVKEYEDGFEVDESSYEDTEALRYYRQAEVDGAVFVFYTYPSR